MMSVMSCGLTTLNYLETKKAISIKKHNEGVSKRL